MSDRPGEDKPTPNGNDLAGEVVASKAEKTMLTALLLSSPGPLVTGIAVASSRSTTQIADFLRRTAELVALFVSWRVYGKLQRAGAAAQEVAPDTRRRMERSVKLWIGGVMAFSGVAMLIIAALNFSSDRAGGKVLLGLVIAILGLATNVYFWLRYGSMARSAKDPIISAQVVLYRAKSFVDFCVVVALGVVLIAPLHRLTRYVDLVGSLVVACYLVWNGLRTIW